MNNKDNLLGVIETIFKWKKHILWTCGATAVLAAIVALILPVYYEATTTFYAASPDLATPEAIFGESAQAPDYYGTDGDMDRLLSIAKSEELASFMIDSFNLYEHYDIDPDSPKGPYAVRLKFNKHFDAIKTKYDAIELSIEDEDKELAAEMTNVARERISHIGQQIIKNSQLKLLKVFEDNISQKTVELDSLNANLKRVRETYGVYNTIAQSESLAELVAKAESKLFNAQAKLEALAGNSRFRDSTTILRARIKGYENQLLKLNERLNSFNQGMAQVEVLKDIQQEAGEKLGEDKEHYKQIKAAYGTDFPTLHLLEAARVPIIKSRPKRTLIVAGATAVAFIFSIIGILLFDTYKDVNWREILHLKK